jgi:shikimate dehydrogenase
LLVDPTGKRALVLGAGGSARAVIWALKGAGALVEVWNRTAAKPEALAEEFGVSVWESGYGPQATGDASIPAKSGDFELLVNCTTIGLREAGSPAAMQQPPLPQLKPLPLDADSVSEEHVVVDLVYGTYPTPLIRLATERGARVVDGLDVLVRQGAASLRLWTGAEPPLATMGIAARSWS